MLTCHSFIVGISGIVAIVVGSIAGAHSIPASQLDEQKIYFGTASNFETPAEINYEEVVKATPEYEKIRKEKIDHGSAKYWILISQASDRAVQAISSVGKNTDYDLIASKGYLNELDPPIAAEDITAQVLAQLTVP